MPCQNNVELRMDKTYRKVQFTLLNIYIQLKLKSHIPKLT